MKLKMRNVNFQAKQVMIQAQSSQEEQVIPEEMFVAAVVALKAALYKKVDNLVKVVLSSFSPVARAELLHRLDVSDYPLSKSFLFAISRKSLEFAKMVLRDVSSEIKFVIIIKSSRYFAVFGCLEIFEMSMKELTPDQKNDLVLYNCSGEWMQAFHESPEILQILLKCALPGPRQEFIQKLLESLQHNSLIPHARDVSADNKNLSDKAKIIVSGYADPTSIAKTDKLNKDIVFARGALNILCKGPCVFKTLPNVLFAHICTFLGIIDFAFLPVVQIPANITLFKTPEFTASRNIVSEEKYERRL
jgi:hypothetical protein